MLVGNPGEFPTISAMVEGLAAAGMLDAYVTTLTASVGGAFGVMAKVPGPIGRAARSGLSRRPDPEGLSPERIHHQGVGMDVATVLARRLPPPSLARALFARSLVLRNRRFDRAMARRLTDHQSAVIGIVTGAEATFERARELAVASFLEYPISHYVQAQRLMQEEAKLQPEFAGTLQYETLPDRLLRRVDREIELADHVFAISEFHRRSFLEAGVPAEKLVLAHLGVDTEMFAPRPRPDDGIFRVIFVGQIGQRKGLSYLLDAFEQADLPDSELLLVGASVGSRAPWRSRPGVRRLPPRPRASLPDVYATADVFVLPSVVEGFALTALEAMACGLPVILSEHTGVNDVIEDGVNGYAVPIRDPEAIAERLRHLHGHPRERKMMGAAARRTAEEHPWRRYGERIASAVRERSGS